jgi:hypothetical protein
MNNEVTEFTETQYKIIAQITRAVSHMGADCGLVANIASWGDTMSDDDTLQNMIDYNVMTGAIKQ